MVPTAKTGVAPHSVDADPAPRASSPIGRDAFAEAFSHLATSVWVVTAGDAEHRAGRTITSLMTISAEPPSLAVSINADSALAKLIARSNGFSLGLLAEDQRAIGNAFAGAVPPEMRFSNGDWAQWPSRRPRLEGAVIDLDCALERTIETHSHLLFIGQVIGARSADRPPLLWHRRAYRGVESGGSV